MALFVIGIGGKLSDGTVHDTRAADYDDWTLNGDILLWNPLLESAFEVSSMGIRWRRHRAVPPLHVPASQDTYR